MRVIIMLTKGMSMQQIPMTPEQILSKALTERMTLSDNAKELQRQALERKASARRKAENIEIGLRIEKD